MEWRGQPCRMELEGGGLRHGKPRSQEEIQVSVPLRGLGLKTLGKLRVLVETLTDKWESADTLPRRGIWLVDPSEIRKVIHLRLQRHHRLKRSPVEQA